MYGILFHDTTVFSLQNGWNSSRLFWATNNLPNGFRTLTKVELTDDNSSIFINVFHFLFRIKLN